VAANVYHASTVVLQQTDLGELAGRNTGEAGSQFLKRYLDRFLGPETVTPKGHMTDDFLEGLRREGGALRGSVIPGHPRSRCVFGV
jgi:hypothetical protein